MSSSNFGSDVESELQLEHQIFLHWHLRTQTCLFKFFICCLGTADGIWIITLYHKKTTRSLCWGYHRNGCLRLLRCLKSDLVVKCWNEVEWITLFLWYIISKKYGQVRVWPLVAQKLLKLRLVVQQVDHQCPIGSSPRCSNIYATKGWSIYDFDVIILPVWHKKGFNNGLLKHGKQLRFIIR